MEEMWQVMATVKDIEVAIQDDNYWVRLTWTNNNDIWMTYETARKLAAVLTQLTK